MVGVLYLSFQCVACPYNEHLLGLLLSQYLSLKEERKET